MDLWNLTAANKYAASADLGGAKGNGWPERPSSNHRPKANADGYKKQSRPTEAVINGRNGKGKAMTLIKLPKIG